MAAHRPVVLAGGRFKQLPPGDKLDVPAEWDALKAPAIDAGVLTLDLATPAGFRVALNQNVTTLSFANVPAGRVVVFTITWVQDATGGRTVAFPSSVKADGGGAPVQPAAGANAVTVQSFYTDDGGATVWQAVQGSGLKYYESLPLAWVAAGELTINHGLGSIPKSVECWVVIKVAVYGLAVGDQVKVVSNFASGTINYGPEPRKPTTNSVSIKIGASGLLCWRADGIAGVLNPSQADLIIKVMA